MLPNLTDINEVIETSDITNTNIIIRALSSLEIQYRKVNLKDSVMFFCELPTGQIFDIQLEEKRGLEIWTFVGKTDIEKAGMKYERVICNNEQIKVGIEVTDEGDLNFYMIQDISYAGKQSVQPAYKLINSYLKMLSCFESENKIM